MPLSVSEPSPLVALLWTLSILLAWIGWGSLLSRLLPTHYRSADWGLMAAWGMAVCVALGGVLNLFALISPGVGIVVVVFGIAAWLVHGIGFLNKSTQERRCPPAAFTFARTMYFGAIILLFCFGLIRLVELAVTPSSMNSHDDFHAYYVFPLRMLQAGWLVADPFNSSQMGALGGQSSLQVLLLSLLPMTYVNLLDPGLCMIVCSALIFGYQRQHRAGPWPTIAAAALPLLAYAILRNSNISAQASTMALYLALYRSLDWGYAMTSMRSASDHIMPALVGAAAIALKSTSIPYVVLLLCFFYVALVWTSPEKRRVVRGVSAALAVAGLILLPWMVIMHLSAGTLLYPFLGEGYRGTTYGTFPSWSQFARPSDLLADTWLILTIALAAVYLRCFTPTPIERTAALCLSMATLGGTLAVLWATAGTSRYTLPFTVVAVFVLTADIARHADRPYTQTRLPPILARGGAWALVFLVGVIMSGSSGLSRGRAASIHVLNVGSLAARLTTPEYPRIKMYDDRRGKVRRAQESIPRGEIFIAKTTAPFLFDFSRNKVYIVDWAHGSSLPPGMPFGKGADALAHYLLSNSIRYVFYEFGKDGAESWYPGGNPRCRRPETAERVLSRAARVDGQDAFECAMDIAMADFVDSLEGLIATRQTVFDDGKLVALDLTKHR